MALSCSFRSSSLFPPRVPASAVIWSLRPNGLDDAQSCDPMAGAPIAPGRRVADMSKDILESFRNKGLLLERKACSLSSESSREEGVGNSRFASLAVAPSLAGISTSSSNSQGC